MADAQRATQSGAPAIAERGERGFEVTGLLELAVRRLEGGDGVSFWIHVSPRAARERIGGQRGDALRVAVCAPPVEGEANAACAEALAGALGVPRSAVALDPAAKGRRKLVRVRGEPDALEAALRGLATGAAIR